MLHWIYYFLLAAVLVGGLYLALLNAPGLWLMVAATLGYALLTHFAYAGLKTLIVIVVLGLIAELIDFLAAGAGAKKAGASKRGFYGAVIGGILGGIFLTVAIPGVGVIIGVCAGTFAGAIIGELWGGTEVEKSLRIGAGAAWGRLLGILTKLLFGCMVLCIVLIAAMPPIFHGSKASGAPAPAPIKSPAVSPAKK
ncbi:MAG TPA: DUF456 domain-containing protein [Tepidisphaeraceae bacterium]|jgi:hypothetical protein|nr:DUF456 domain-containing protein [Tepidisphaeraceae bacterium]